MKNKLLQTEFDKYKALVVGDVMIDEYCHGTISRISPEYPVPVFNFETNEYRLGGAANVAKNLRAIGFQVDLLGIVGSDKMAEILLNLCREDNIGIDEMLKLQGFSTIVKTRYLNQSNVQILRVDKEISFKLPDILANAIIEKIEKIITNYNCIFISDYLKGLLTKEVTQRLIDLANKNNVLTFVDVKDKDYSKYSNCYLLKPNKAELKLLTGMDVSNMENIKKAVKHLKDTSSVKNIVATLGEKGMLLLNESNKFFYFPTIARHIFDVTGAGDTVLSYLGAMNVIGFNLEDSIKLSNMAAGIKVSFLGTTPVKVELLLNELEGSIDSKELSLESFLNIKGTLGDKKIVFTNGCFDVLHVGHLKCLKTAKSYGDVLVVGLNSDKSIKRLKGENRPYNNLQDRIDLLSGLECVDYIIVFDEDTPINLIKGILPDFLIKGGDYNPKTIVGYDDVVKNGGQVIVTDFIKDRSTTNILNKIKDE